MHRNKIIKEKKLNQEELLSEISRLKKELKKKKKYGLVWEEKKEDVVEMCKEKLPVLVEDKSKAINEAGEDDPVNILIEGDNYHALSALNYTHEGKIDVIYIDPPYNTGNKDFKFNDVWIDSIDAFKHSKWISFMHSRLMIARKLLKNNGVIFISINNIEFGNLKILMDEIFNSNNILNFIWKNTNNPNTSSSNIGIEHEYICCYAIDSNFTFQDLIISKNIIEKEYKYKDEHYKTRGPYKLVGFNKTGTRRDRRPNLEYDIISPEGTIIKANPRWRWEKDRFIKGIEEGRIFFGKSKSKWSISYKQYLNEKLNKLLVDENNNILERGIPSYSILDEQGTTTEGTNVLNDIIGKDKFDFPKPPDLIKYLIKIGGKENITILDFFSGSGTTGQSVLELNQTEDYYGKRKFILVTNNENNICKEVCYPRVSKVIKGYKNLKGEKVKGLGGNLRYYKTEFVDSKQTDKNKKLLTEKATDMLCIKEDTYDEVKTKNKHFRIFKRGNKYTGIIYDYMEIDAFKEFIKKIDGKFSVYIFSLGDDTFDEEFENFKNKVKLSPIPEAIMRVYRRVFK